MAGEFFILHSPFSILRCSFCLGWSGGGSVAGLAATKNEGNHSPFSVLRSRFSVVHFVSGGPAAVPLPGWR
jgi:hypothetical protein